jgi:hypothetical protein
MNKVKLILKYLFVIQLIVFVMAELFAILYAKFQEHLFAGILLVISLALTSYSIFMTLRKSNQSENNLSIME